MSTCKEDVEMVSGKMSVERFALVLALGTFAAGTGEFAIGAILPEIAGSLNVGLAQAGQLVTVFALSYAVLSPVLATLTGSWLPRHVLMAALGVYVIAISATALAPTYGVALASQVLAAAGSGLFTPMAGATAAALAPADQQGRAISITTSGLALSVALGVPLGTVLSVFAGWRGTMWFVVVLSLIALMCIAAFLPHAPKQPPVGLRERLTPVKDSRVASVLVTSVFIFTGIFILYTYVSAAFERAIGGESANLAVLVLSWGAAGTVGALVSGRFADRFGARKVVGISALVLIAVFASLPFSSTNFASSIVVMFVYGLAAWCMTAPQQQRLIQLAPNSASLVVSLNASALFIGVSLSGVVGAAGLQMIGAPYLGLVAAAFVIVGLCFSESAHQLAKDRKA